MLHHSFVSWDARKILEKCLDDADSCQVMSTADCGVTGMMTGCVSTVTLCDMSDSTEQVEEVS